MKNLFIYTGLLFLGFSLNLSAQNVGDIIITEIMYNPDTVTDTKGEWFEVFNTTQSSIDMKNWTISDLVTSKKILTTLIVPPLGFAVLARTGDTLTNGGLQFDYAYGTINFNNGGDKITVLDSMDNVIDQVEYSSALGFPSVSGASIVFNISGLVLLHQENNDGSNWIKETIDTYGLGDFGTPGYSNNPILDIVKLNESTRFELLPNFITDNKFSIKGADGWVKTVIYDLLGNEVYNQVMNTNIDYNLSLPSGIYTVRVDNQVSKLIIR